MDIRTLVTQGNLKGALEQLVNKGDNNAIMLMFRYNKIVQDHNMGLCTESMYQRTINQITHVILDSSDLDISAPEPLKPIQKPKESTFNERALLEIVIKNKRRRPEIAKEANQILADYRAWKDKKTIPPAFDPVGRRLRAVQQKANALIERLREKKEIDLEKIIERISTLLEEPIPTYEALAKAYKLASGRGFNSTYIENQLKSKPDDEEVKITIAEQIEAYTLEIRQD